MGERAGSPRGIVRLAVQERRRLFREGLAMCLDAEPELAVVAAVATAPEVLRVCEQHPVDAVVLEVDVTEWDAFRIAAALTRRHRALRVVGIYTSLSNADAGRAR